MSTTEEKKHAAAENGHGKTGDQHAPARPGTWRFLIPVVAFGVGLVSHLFLGWIIFPMLLYGSKEQPIDFNHKIHQEAVDEGCESCHFFREDGSFNGIPKLEKCAECHEDQMGESPEEARLVEEYIGPGKEIPWHVYSQQPQCVFFSHAAHVVMGKIECVTCHGPIGESEHLRPYEYNRITLYSRDIWGQSPAGYTTNTWDRMKMDVCAECHEEKKGGKDACFVCHK